MSRTARCASNYRALNYLNSLYNVTPLSDLFFSVCCLISLPSPCCLISHSLSNHLKISMLAGLIRDVVEAASLLSYKFAVNIARWIHSSMLTQNCCNTAGTVYKDVKPRKVRETDVPVIRFNGVKGRRRAAETCPDPPRRVIIKSACGRYRKFWSFTSSTALFTYVPQPLTILPCVLFQKISPTYEWVFFERG